MSMAADTVGGMEIAAPVDDADVPRYWRELGLPGLVDTHVHFLPARVQAKVWQYFADGREALRRRLAAGLRPARGRAAGRPRPARRAGLPDAAVSAQGRHGRLAQRLVGGVRAATGRRCCSRPRSTPSRRRPSTSPRRSSAGPDLQGARAGGAVRPAARAARRGVGAAGGDRYAGGHPLRLGPTEGRAHRAAPVTGLLERHPAAAAGHRPPRHARVPRLPRAGRALRAGAPGHHDVRHRLHRAADAVRPRPTCRGCGRCGTRCCSAATSRRSRTPTPTNCRRCTGSAWGRTGCAPCCGTTAPGCSGSRRDPELLADRLRPGHARPAGPRPLLPAAARLADPRRRRPTGRPCGPRTAAPGCPSSWRPTTCRRCGRRSRARSRCSSTSTSRSTTSTAAGASRRRPAPALGGHETDDEDRAGLTPTRPATPSAVRRRRLNPVAPRPTPGAA